MKNMSVNIQDVILNISELDKVMCKHPVQGGGSTVSGLTRRTDLMTFSKSASLCDTDVLTSMSLQKQDAKSGASRHQTASSWKSVFELAFLSAALHCALYIVWIAQLQAIFPGQKCASRGVYALSVYWGIHCLKVTDPPFTSVCFTEVARTHRTEIPGMLSMTAQRRTIKFLHRVSRSSSTSRRK